jgi:tetratricopeptide (TPR) repeat protein
MTVRLNFGALLLYGVLLWCGCATSRYQNVNLYMRQNNWPKAQEELEIHLFEHPGDSKARLLLAEVYGEQGKADKMLKVLADLPDDNDRHSANITFIKKKYWIQNLQAGARALEAKNFTAAAGRFFNAVLIASVNVHSRQSYADALFLSGNAKASAGHYERLLQENPDDLIVKNNLSEAYFADRRYAACLLLCEQILATDAHHLAALTRRAYTLDALGSVVEAEQEFEYLARSFPSAQLLTDLGLLYFRKGAYEKAIPVFNQALALSQGYQVIYRYLGEASWRLRDYAAMAHWFEKLVAVYPEDVSGWRNLIVAYQALGRNEALANARQQIHSITGTN